MTWSGTWRENTPVHLEHLEQRLRQTGGWARQKALTHADLLTLLSERFGKLDVAAAKRDVLPFLKDSASVELWSREFFDGLLLRLRS